MGLSTEKPLSSSVSTLSMRISLFSLAVLVLAGSASAIALSEAGGVDALSASSLKQRFEQWIVKHSRKYPSVEKVRGQPRIGH